MSTPSHPLRVYPQVTPRSVIIGTLGVLWTLIGIGVWAGDVPIFTEDPLATVPDWARGIVWIATGLYAIYAAVTHWHKHQAIGLLVIMPAVRSFAYVIAWIGYLTGAEHGLEYGWYYAPIHIALCIAVFATAYIPPTPRDDTEEA